MNIARWVVQGLLAIAFLFAGFMKTFLPIPELATQMAFVADLPEPLIRFIGVAELAGAVGLLLPAITRILPCLTALSATGLGGIVVLGAVFHISRGEFTSVMVPVIILALAVFVAYGRRKVAPITARS